MANRYRRKFRVASNSRVHECKKLCKKIHTGYETILPPCMEGQTLSYYGRRKDKSRCSHIDMLGKPIMYIVSQTVDGEWQCSCPRWKFKRIACTHIRSVSRNPSAYHEIDPEFTGKTTEILDKVFANLAD